MEEILKVFCEIQLQRIEDNKRDRGPIASVQPAMAVRMLKDAVAKLESHVSAMNAVQFSPPMLRAENAAVQQALGNAIAWQAADCANWCMIIAKASGGLEDARRDIAV